MPNNCDEGGPPLPNTGHAPPRRITKGYAPPRGESPGHAASRSDSGLEHMLRAGPATLPAVEQSRSNGTDAFLPDLDIIRATSTITQYQVRFDQLSCRFTLERGLLVEEDPEAFTAWLLALAPTLRPNSYRLYRAATNLGLHSLHHKAGMEFARDRIAAALTGLKGPVPQRTAECPGLATSARKLKRLGAELLAELDAALSELRGSYDAALRAYFPAGCATGLRPCEWRRARLVVGADHVVLVVRNAKATHGRAHGRYRRLVFDNPAAADVVAVWLRHLRGPQGWLRRDPAEFDAFIAALRARIRHFGQVLWPRRRSRPTLYSARHTFAARAKRRYSTVEVAALMGHANDATAQSHYARPSRAGGAMGLEEGALPRPHPRDLARVRAVYAERRAYLDAQAELDDDPRP